MRFGTIPRHRAWLSDDAATLQSGKVVDGAEWLGDAPMRVADSHGKISAPARWNARPSFDGGLPGCQPFGRWFESGPGSQNCEGPSAIPSTALTFSSDSVVSAKRSKGWRRVAVSSPFFQEQFETRK
jgi:hypothetical protein